MVLQASGNNVLLLCFRIIYNTHVQQTNGRVNTGSFLTCCSKCSKECFPSACLQRFEGGATLVLAFRFCKMNKASMTEWYITRDSVDEIGAFSLTFLSLSVLEHDKPFVCCIPFLALCSISSNNIHELHVYRAEYGIESYCPVLCYKIALCVV